MRELTYVQAGLEAVAEEMRRDGKIFYMSTDPIVLEAERRRTFAIISHPDAGKTTITEKLLLFGNAIALAGGFTPSAVESAVYVRREGSNIEVKMPVDRSTAIRPGDVVRVNTTMFADVMQLINPLSTPLSIAAAAAVP